MRHNFDNAPLHSSEVLGALLRQYEEPRGNRNGKPYFTCHIHQHKHPDKPHLRIEERNGKAVAVCDSYGVVGDTFAVYGEYTGEREFIKQKKAIAELVGVADNPPTRRARLRKSRPGASEVHAQEPPAPTACIYLTPEQESRIWQAVERAKQDTGNLSAHALELRLSVFDLFSRTDKENAALGMLGIWDDNRLAYVYTAMDKSGQWRALKAKLRNPAGAVNRFESWPTTGSNPPPWGWESAHQAEIVIMVEGESDALAVYSSLESLFSYELGVYPDTYCQEIAAAPAVVAVPGAGTFKREHAAALRDKAVIIAFDRDKAGDNGAARTADILHAAGVRTVYRWTPPPPYKDAREYHDRAEPCKLADSILKERSRI